MSEWILGSRILRKVREKETGELGLEKSPKEVRGALASALLPPGEIPPVKSLLVSTPGLADHSPFAQIHTALVILQQQS